jgi:hypothetical protein
MGIVASAVVLVRIAHQRQGDEDLLHAVCSSNSQSPICTSMSTKELESYLIRD